MNSELHIIVLAAGEGTRMKSRLPKVLQAVGGRPMLAHVLETAAALEPARLHVVYGSGGEAVPEAMGRGDLEWVHQAERLGTGHAVMQAMPAVPDDARVMVLYGDHPLTPVDVLRDLAALPEDALGVLTMTLGDPTGYGRIVRDADGVVVAVVEERDATPSERALSEVNTGMIVAGAERLRGWLGRLDTANSQGEYYLTDIFAMASADGVPIQTVRAPDARDLAGANDRAQLAALEQRHRRRAAERLMAEGVHVADPERIDLRGDIRCGMDVFLDVNVVLEGRVRLGEGVRIGVGAVLRDCELAAGTTVLAYSVLDGVVTTGACDIGPFARLRPGTELAAGSRVGNFVEMKKARLGEGSKASHLSYVGDSLVGKGVNIGAGTITCNYDGVNKHRTVIEDGAFIGSDTQLVAPVTVGRDATIAAGTTLTRDAPAGQLTLSRTKQTTLRGWKRPKKRD